ncbi:uncharacterized protein N7483_013046 [Penicillium malachiteum]|uniref:uncharacterized protein n=1 Tax=Penicillium malachiteum TaxID=1324776 RepID=UPI002547E668|nr:uncharacterized protein N7483_013046 [Penicillium malachiteum]KAJ5715865.1 hypothetical protein N7483_013046 [Penicillium malachiteum]
MIPHIFITGATGYVGGDFLHVITAAHPEWKISALVRNSEKAAKLISEYPTIRIVAGDFDSVSLIEEEVKDADIVFQIADCDHTGVASAIAKGATHHTTDRPCWVIHASGTASFIFEDMREKTCGIERTKEYNDWDGLHELLNLPDDACHRDVEKIILAAGQMDPQRIKTAILSPPTVHVHDLSDLFLLLGEAAAAGGGNATWGNEGYYLSEMGSYAWGDVSRAIAQVACEKGYIPTAEVTNLEENEPVGETLGYGSLMWGSNSRGTSIRARKLLGWTPKRPTLLEEIPGIVDGQARALGIAALGGFKSLTSSDALMSVGLGVAL